MPAHILLPEGKGRVETDGRVTSKVPLRLRGQRPRSAKTWSHSGITGRGQASGEPRGVSEKPESHWRALRRGQVVPEWGGWHSRATNGANWWRPDSHTGTTGSTHYILILKLYFVSNSIRNALNIPSSTHSALVFQNYNGECKMLLQMRNYFENDLKLRFTLIAF